MGPNEVWYTIENNFWVPHVDGVVCIGPDTFCSYKNTIQASIDSFNNNIVWTEMWDLEDAESRLNEGHVLFIGVDKEGPLAHVWFDKDYLYNMYVNPRRPDGYGVNFLKFCLQFIAYPKISVYCDDWNVRAQKFFEKIGFEQNSKN